VKPIRVTGVYVHSSESGYVAYIAEFPTIYAQGETIEEARKMLLAGLELWLTSNRHETRRTFEGRPVMKRETIATIAEVPAKEGGSGDGTIRIPPDAFRVGN
jgi:predicted RNase H-like HicB family nuclease